MRIDLLSFGLVERHESVEDVVACSGVIWAAFVVREVILHWRDWQLLLEPINLVQEQNDAGLDEPPRIANAVEECERFLHSVDSLVFEQQLIVLRNSDEEQNSGDVFEAVDPLLSL